jgi:hypothetical protein
MPAIQLTLFGRALRRGLVFQRLARIAQHQLRAAPGARERQRLDASTHQQRQYAGSLDIGAASLSLFRQPGHTALPVGQRRVPEQEGARSLWRAIVVDHLHLIADQRCQVLLWVGAGRRATDKLRRAAVMGAQPSQPPHDQRDVGAEHAPIDVRLIQYDIAQPRQDPLPARMVRQQRAMEQIGVRQNDMRPGAQTVARRTRRIAIQGRCRKRRTACCFERRKQTVQRAQLVGGERLGGEEEQRAGVVIGDRCFNGRQLIAESLPRCRRRHDADMITGARCIERSRLVGIEARDSACSKRRSERLRQRRGRFRKARGARRQALDMRNLTSITARAAQ